ncbi:MAG: uracil-DNA glycosylase [Elusimicrobia bacterium]|nr:uracil-DNA glycosylase [Elusimicrobiota bacterium]
MVLDRIDEILASRTYDEFRRRLADSDCPRCALCESRTHIVVSRGNPKAKIMVIGEAPGEKEDLQAKAFVGRAGQVFDQIMASIGLDTNRDMYITNIVKCRPPGNRAPQKAEAEACRPFLEKQLQIIRPKVIVLLGATALRYIAPGIKSFSMKEKAGTLFDIPAFPGAKFMVFYHPAAVFYNSTLRTAMWEHAKILKQFLHDVSSR